MMLLTMVHLVHKTSCTLVGELNAACFIREIVPLGASAGRVLALAVTACEGAIINESVVSSTCY